MKHTTKYLAALLAVCFAVTASGPAVNAETVVYDHFDAAELDSAWTVSFDRVQGWTYSLSLSSLFVSDIEYDSLHGGWSSVILSQDFDSLADLSVLLTLGWESNGVNSAMQNVMMTLRDTTGDDIIWALYHDAWDQNRGRISAGIGETMYSGPNNLPHAGQGTIEIERNAGTVTIYWEGVEIFAGTVNTPIDRLELWFMVGAWPTATFGELSVDLISCEGTVHTPVRKTTWGSIRAMQ